VDAVGAKDAGGAAAAGSVADGSFAGFDADAVVVVFVGRGGSLCGRTGGRTFVAGEGVSTAGRTAGVRDSADDDGEGAASRCKRADSSAALLVISAFVVSAFVSLRCSLPAVATDVGSFDVGGSEAVARVSITSGRTSVVWTNVRGSWSDESFIPPAFS
jgi:hypothetical protein